MKRRRTLCRLRCSEGTLVEFTRGKNYNHVMVFVIMRIHSVVRIFEF
jgi:hypothetical protein